MKPGGCNALQDITFGREWLDKWLIRIMKVFGLWEIVLVEQLQREDQMSVWGEDTVQRFSVFVGRSRTAGASLQDSLQEQRNHISSAAICRPHWVANGLRRHSGEQPNESTWLVRCGLLRRLIVQGYECIRLNGVASFAYTLTPWTLQLTGPIRVLMLFVFPWNNNISKTPRKVKIPKLHFWWFISNTGNRVDIRPSSLLVWSNISFQHWKTNAWANIR